MKHTVTLALFMLLATTVCAEEIKQKHGLPSVQNFMHDAKEVQADQKPILVLFMSNSCHYCEQALEEFLLPIQRDPEYDSKVILRRIDVNSGEKLTDFQGNITTQKAFAKKQKIFAVPTIILFGQKGQVLATIVGLLTLDYYQAYLDQAIDESQEKIKVLSK